MFEYKIKIDLKFLKSSICMLYVFEITLNNENKM